MKSTITLLIAIMVVACLPVTSNAFMLQPKFRFGFTRTYTVAFNEAPSIQNGFNCKINYCDDPIGYNKRRTALFDEMRNRVIFHIFTGQIAELPQKTKTVKTWMGEITIVDPNPENITVTVPKKKTTLRELKKQFKQRKHDNPFERYLDDQRLLEMKMYRV